MAPDGAGARLSLGAADTYRAHFLPPVGRAASSGDLFDATLLPHLTFEIAPCAGTDCGTPTAVFGADEAGGPIRLGDDHYHVNWSTRGVPEGQYRVLARAAGTPIAESTLQIEGRGGAGGGRFRQGSTVPLKLFVPAGAVTLIGPAGGTVESGSFRLDFPVDAVEEFIGVTVLGADLPDPERRRLIPGTGVSLGPDGATFKKQVRLTIRYAEADLEGAEEAGLRLQRRSVTGWTDVDAIEVNATSNTVTGLLDGFSDYGVVTGLIPPGVLGGFGTATADGNWTATEWDNASAVSIDVAVPEGGTVPGTIYVMNDYDSLYVSLVYARSFAGERQRLLLAFDHDHDGQADEGEDQVLFVAETEQRHTDQFVTSACGRETCDDDDVTNGTNDGRGAYTHDGVQAVFEIARPLDSADDLHDLNASAGDTIGFALGVTVISEAPNYDDNFTFFPAQSFVSRAALIYHPLAVWPGPRTVVGGAGTATMDGSLAGGEYPANACTFFQAGLPEGGTTPVYACIMNDAANLYLGLAIDRTFLDPGVTVALQLDTDGDEVIDQGDDLVTIDRVVGFNDQCWISTGAHGSDTLVAGGTIDGSGILLNDGTYTVVELWHPLASTTACDIDVTPGEWLGAALQIVLTDGAGNAVSTVPDEPVLWLVRTY